MDSDAARALATVTVPVVVCGPEGELLLVNEATSALVNRPASELVGRPLVELLAPRSTTVDGRPTHDVLRDDARRGDPPFRRLTVRRTPDLEIEVDIGPALLPGDGALVLTLAERCDIAEREGRSESYRLIFENAPLGIFHFDDRGVITECNQNFVDIIGSSRQVLVGLDMLTLPDQGIVECVHRCLRGETASYEGDYHSATASKITPVSVLFAPITENDHITGGVGMVRDDTARVAAQRRLAHAERLASLGALAAGVAHEINNPLTYIMTSVQASARKLALEGAPTGVPSLLEAALDGAERVRRIVHDLRMFSRVDDEQQQAGPVDLHAVLDAAANLAAGEIKHRGRLIKDYGDVGAVLGDEVRLGQVFINLLVNAGHALEEDRAERNRVVIRTRPASGGALIEVEDNGGGIPPGVLERVFEPFVTTKPIGVGTGLGLPICQSIVTALGGDITVASVPGEGTTIRVFLRGTSSAPPLAPAPPPEVSASGGRLLLIDDEPRLLGILRDELAERHEVVTATNGREALEILLADGRFDLVLCDVIMPHTNGLELYRAVARLRPKLAERFVFMTGGVFDQDMFEELSRLPLPRLEKPFPLERIEALLRQRL